MTQTNDPPLVASVALIPDSDEKADLDAPSDESGKLVVSQAPNITITSTTVVADQAERLALDPQEGDIAIQQDKTESFIFTGGANELANWQLVQFDAVGGIAGEDIAPRDIDGRNVTLTDLSVNGLLNGADTSGAAAGEALTSDGQGGFGFSPTGSAAITRNGNEIEYVALFTSDLPSPTNSGDIGLVTNANQYVQDSLIGTPFDISRADNSATRFDSDAGFNVSGLAFSDDGTKLYQIKDDPPEIFQSTLSTPFNLFSKSFDKSISGQSEFIASGIAISADGTKLFEAERNSGAIHQFTLSTAFDIGTASLEKSVAPEGSKFQDIDFSTDGSILYEAEESEFGGDDHIIHQIELTTPFDVGTKGSSQRIDSQTAEDSLKGIHVAHDGSRLYEVGDQAQIFQSSLSTPFDITTASFDFSVDMSQGTSGSGVFISTDGFKMFVSVPGGGEINSSELVSGPSWQTI